MNNSIAPLVSPRFIKQNDVQSNVIEIKVRHNRKPVDLYGYAISVGFVKPSGEIELKTNLDSFNPITVNDDTLKCVVPSVSLTDVGVVRMEVTLTKQGGLSHSQTVEFEVEPSLTNLFVPDTEDLPILQSLIERVQDLIAELEVMSTQEEQRELNENDRMAQELLRVALYDRLVLLEQALTELESTTTDNEIERQANEVVRQSLYDDMVVLRSSVQGYLDTFDTVLTDFEQNSTQAIIDLENEIERVNTMYLARLVTVEEKVDNMSFGTWNELVNGKVD